MARIDKYNPVSGGFRARLGFAPVAGEVGDIIGVTINSSGLVVKASATDADGVICLSSLLAQGDVVDVMTHGEIVDVAASGEGVTTPAAGADVYAAASGALTTTAPTPAGTNGVRIGNFVEAWRLVVRVQKFQA